MKLYRSKDKTVEKALNKGWRLIMFPFFGLWITIMILGFYLIDKYENGGAYPLVFIFGGLFVAAVVGYFMSKFWFSKQLQIVVDKVEFIERSKRIGLIWPSSSADKIIMEQGVTQTERIKRYEGYLQDLFIQEELILTNDFIKLGWMRYKWADIHDFKISSMKRSFSVTLIFKDDNSVCESFSYYKKGINIEYEIDRYLNNEKSKPKAV